MVPPVLCLINLVFSELAFKIFIDRISALDLNQNKERCLVLKY